MTYNQLLNRCLALLEEEGPQAALELLQSQKGQLQNFNDAQLYNFAYCLEALAGRTDRAMGLLQEAVYHKGYWYDYEYLMEDEDLEELRQHTAFEQIANLCRQRQQAAQAAAKPQMQLQDVKAGKPVVMVLHGDQQNAQITAPYWQQVKQLGYGLAAIQSTELQVSDGYLWDDEEQAAKQIAAHWQSLQEQGVDVQNSILGGFSSGARACLYAVLSKAVQPKGLILVAPWLPELEEWAEQLEALKQAGTAVYICCGDADEDCFEGSEQLFELLDEAGIEVDFKLCPDLDHDYPENFDQLLGEAIGFVKGE